MDFWLLIVPETCLPLHQLNIGFGERVGNKTPQWHCIADDAVSLRLQRVHGVGLVGDEDDGL